MHNNGIRIDRVNCFLTSIILIIPYISILAYIIQYLQIPRDEESIQIPYVPMLQPVLGDTYWYYLSGIAKLKGTNREPEHSTVTALPVHGCNLVFRFDRISKNLRVQFQIQKGSFDLVVNELQRSENRVLSMREQFLGRWIRDDIDDVETWLLIVAVEVNTENVASTDERKSSKKQEVFGAKVSCNLCLLISLFFFLNA